jgi:hypothetical protein
VRLLHYEFSSGAVSALPAQKTTEMRLAFIALSHDELSEYLAANFLAKMSDNSPDAWREWLCTFRKRFVAAQGWTRKDAKRYLRDGWVVCAMAILSRRSPRDIVLGLLSQVEHADGPDESDEIKRKRHAAAFWTCENKVEADL